MSQPPLALLGLGTMGARMSERLLAAGFPLTVYNRSLDKAAPLAALGARVAATPREAAQGADIVIGMVTDDRVSRSVWLGEDGALSGTHPGAIVVESSTLTVGWVKELAAAAEARGCEFVDAPVTGSKLQAAAGELNFLVGGSVDALERIRPVLSVMARSITHLGPTGSGALVKLINNFVCGAQLASFAEAMAIIERTGLDRGKTVEILLGGAPGSPLVKLTAGRMMTPDFTPNFQLHLLAKDLGYAIHEARERSIDLTTAKTALALFQNAVAEGDGEKDMAAVVEQFRRK